MADVHAVLGRFGLGARERDVYLQLLKTGTAPASTLGRRAGINKSTTQYACQKLVKRGLARMVKRNSTFLYTAESPEKFLLLLGEKRRMLERDEREVQRILHELHQMMNPNAVHPRVQFFEGEHIKDLYAQLLDLHSPILCAYTTGSPESHIIDVHQWYIRQRNERRIPMRAICPQNDVCVLQPAELRDVRIIPMGAFPFSCDFEICKDTVAILSYRKGREMGVMIQSEDIAQCFRLVFEWAWGMLSG